VCFSHDGQSNFRRGQALLGFIELTTQFRDLGSLWGEPTDFFRLL
jgi:hypothetical protein